MLLAAASFNTAPHCWNNFLKKQAIVVAFIGDDNMVWMKPELSGISPHPRSLHSAEVFNNRLYIFGGWNLAPRDDVLQQEEQFETSNNLSCFNLGELCSLVLTG